MIPEKKTAEKWQEAAQLYHAGDLNPSKQICKEIIASERHADTYHLLAHIAEKEGDLKQSIAWMHQALELNPSSPNFHNNMGSLLSKQGKHEEGIQYFKNAVRYNPNYIEAHFNLGFTLVQCGQHEAALPYYQKTIALKPDLCDAHTNLGNIYMKMGQTQNAIKSYQSAYQQNPNDPVLSVNLSLALERLSDWESAKTVLQNALHHHPYHPDLLLNLGNIHHYQGNIPETIACFKKALIHAPQHIKIWYNLGTTFMEAEHYIDARDALEKTLALCPNHLQALNNMGMVRHKIGNNDTAVTYLKKALEIDPNFSEAHNNIGLAYKRLEQTEQALEHLKKATTLDPTFGDAFHNLSELQRELRQYDDAVVNSAKAIQLSPDMTPALANHAYLMAWMCDWDAYDQVEAALDRVVRQELQGGNPVGEPHFINIIRMDDAAGNRQVADQAVQKLKERSKHLKQAFSHNDRTPPDSHDTTTIKTKGTTNSISTTKPPPANHRAHSSAPTDMSIPEKKITIGYLSSNFRNHPMAHLLVSLFSYHNRNDFQINGYSLGPDDNSNYRQRIIEGCDTFRDIRELSHIDAAQQIYDDGVDILIDLMGYTQGNRPEISALRPAPLQVRYMGMPGTMGGDLFDYIIVDETVLPKDTQKHYAETFIYMPHTYQINDETKPIDPKPVSRTLFNLPEEAFVFCSFNTSYKIDAVIFSAWMDILKAIDGSVLWLMPDSDGARKNLRNTASHQGVDPDRLIFAKSLPISEHLARLSLADLALDTRRVGGAATTSDALWSGLPVITLLGNRFISRMSASILSAIGLASLITNTIDEYKALAVTLAHDRQKLKDIKETLTQNITTHPLFDTLGFTLNFEKALKMIWQNHCQNDPPQLLDLKEEIKTLSTATALYPHEYGASIRKLTLF